jgi:hypothetical protein
MWKNTLSEVSSLLLCSGSMVKSQIPMTKSQIPRTPELPVTLGFGVWDLGFGI